MQPVDVIQAVAAEYGLTYGELVGRGRRTRVVAARFTAALLLREVAGLSYARIGTALGSRDHSSAHYAVQTAYSWRRDRPSYANRLNTLIRTLSPHGRPQ